MAWARDQMAHSHLNVYLMMHKISSCIVNHWTDVVHYENINCKVSMSLVIGRASGWTYRW